jgi:3-hydroxyacyl-[acyl-carrier-protein] dehydratase
MPPTPLIDPLTLNLEAPVRGIEDVRSHNKQRFEMEMLSGVAVLDFDRQLVVGFKDLSDKDFWVRGHIPGRPILPGVLQIEAAAQATSYYYMEYKGNPPDLFIGFMGVTDVKFRGFVEPSDTFIIAAQAIELRSRRCEFYCQGFVRDKMVFEGTVLGAPM